jgi:hypothetical protein
VSGPNTEREIRSRSKDARRARRTGIVLLAAAGGIVLSLLASACGGASPPKPGSTGTTDTQAVKFAQCMRSNGVTNWPDPSRSGRAPSLNQIDANSPAFERAYAACRKDAPSGQPGGPAAPTAVQLRFALTFARCMRTHGFPQFPDPLTTYGPGLTLGKGEYFPLNNTTDFQTPSPAFRQAAKTCGVQLPSGP